MNVSIEARSIPLKEVFGPAHIFTIPSYQRPYSWGVEQAVELVTDLRGCFESHRVCGDGGVGLSSYFLGSIVLIKSPNDPNSEVIDGQQRLTTLTLLLATIASLFPVDDREMFASYFSEEGKTAHTRGTSKPRLELRDGDFYRKFIMSMNINSLIKHDAEQLDNATQRKMRENCLAMRDDITKEWKASNEKLLDFVKFLMESCFLVVVSTPDTDSAFTIFTVMNSRGLDLQTCDLIKSSVIGKIAQEGRDNYADKWEQLEKEVEAAAKGGFDDLFSHIRMVYAKTKPSSSIRKGFEQYVMNNAAVGGPERLIDEVLTPYAESYVCVRSSDYSSEQPGVGRDVNAMLRWLNRMDNSDWVPSAIAFLKQKKKTDAEHVRWFFTKLERLSAYMLLTGMYTGRRINRYGEVLKELEGDHEKGRLPAIELNDEEKKRMKEVIDDNVYQMPARRRSYLVLRLDSFISEHAVTYEIGKHTIEHVLPQTVEAGSEWARLWPDGNERMKWQDRIANLVLLTQRRNSKARNFDFAKKKDAYFSGKSGVTSYALTTQLVNTYKVWSPAAVKKRQKFLMDIVRERWEL